LVIVTLAAADGDAEPDLAGRVDAIHHGFDAELLLIDAAFPVRQRVAMKTRRGFLIDRCRRQNIACDLLNGELVVWYVRVERLDGQQRVLGRLRPVVDPGAERGDFICGLRVRLIGRHLHFGIDSADDLDQSAMPAIARLDNRTGIAALERLSTVIETKAARLL